MKFRPDAVLVNGEFHSNMVVSMLADGTLQSVGEDVDETTVPRKHRVWMPGFVNSHSHVFQRVMRGLGERQTSGATFWSWRESMYRVVDGLDPDRLESIARYTFHEMMSAGYTSVKEFHYIHHGRSGAPYSDPNEMAKRVIAAGQSAGISMTLLRVLYLSVAETTQQRFCDPDIDTAFRWTTRLASEVPVSVGLAPHSIRACTPDQISEAIRWSKDHGMECHMHIAEQPREVNYSLERYGQRPLATIADSLDSHVVGVHMTHLSDREIKRAGEAGMTACICPTTEGSLGDGLPSLREMLDAGVRLSIGSDSNVVIDPFAEVRMLEFNERNRKQARRVVDPGSILEACTEPVISGQPTNWLELDTTHPALVGVPMHELVSAVVLSGRPDCIAGTWSGGQFRPREQPDPSRYLRALEQLL